MSSESTPTVSTTHRGEDLHTSLADQRRPVERAIADASFRDRLADAAARGSKKTFPALVAFKPDVRSARNVLNFLEMAVLPRTSLSSSRIQVQHTFSRLTRDDEIEKRLVGGDYPRRYGGVAVEATASVLLRLSESALIESVEEDTPWQMSLDRVGRMVHCDVGHRGDITGKGSLSPLSTLELTLPTRLSRGGSPR